MFPEASLCPQCHLVSPVIRRGGVSVCVSCGAPRSPLAAVPVDVAGKPTVAGGTVARVFGWVVLAGGVLFAMLVALITGLIFGGVTAAIFGGIVAAIAAVASYFILKSGKELQERGERRSIAMSRRALSTIAARDGGVVTPASAARALNMSEQQAEALLTALVRSQDDVRLEVDDDGRLLYLFGDVVAPRRVRVNVSGGDPVRIATGDTELPPEDDELDLQPRERSRRA